jgi:mono/diheme cytochrome c family protein
MECKMSKVFMVKRSRLNGQVILFMTAAFLFLAVTKVQALPFNSDMVDVQKRTGLIMRALPKGSVPVGFEEVFPETKAEATKLTNPIPAEPKSVEAGSRLFRVNCYPCHGDISKNPYQPGPVSVNSNGAIPAMNVGAANYLERTDGYIFATIHFGGLVIMPPLGWKLSDQEHWDIVNYLRSVQNANLAKQKAQ